jgi:hemin uptake protein HemP
MPVSREFAVSAASVCTRAEAEPPVAAETHVVRGRRVLLSTEVLQGAREVLIEHRGLFYSLRETGAGKLILTK